MIRTARAASALVVRGWISRGRRWMEGWDDLTLDFDSRIDGN